MSYEWSDYKRKYYLDGKEIFVESYTISSNEKESIHEIFTVKDRETGISRMDLNKICPKCNFTYNQHVYTGYEWICPDIEKGSGGVDFYEDYKNDVLLPQIEKSFPNHILIEKEEFEKLKLLEMGDEK